MPQAPANHSGGYSDSRMMYNVVQRSYKNNLLILKIAGIYDEKLFQNFVYRIYGWTLYIVLAIGFPSLMMLYVALNENVDLYKAIDASFLSVQLGIFPIKYITFMLNAGDVSKFLKKLEQQSFRPSLPSQKKYVEDYITKCRLLFYLYGMCSLTSMTVWGMRPYYTKDKIIPIDIWLPFELTIESTLYWPTYLYIQLSLAHGVCLNISIDTMLATMMYYATAQIKILKDTLQSVSERAEDQVSHIKNEEERKTQKNIIVYRELKMCICHYDAIHEFIKEYEQIFSLGPFSQLAASIVVICVSCFELLIIEPLSGTFVGMVIFVVTMLSQIYLYCFYGNGLFYESSTITNAIYMSEWYEFDEKCKKAILILMERTKRPMYVTVGKILTLSIETFASVIRKAYSLLAVLKNYR